MDFGIGNNFYDLLVSNKEVKRVEKSAKRDQAELNKVNNVAYTREGPILGLALNGTLEVGPLKLASLIMQLPTVLSDAQAKKLVAAEKRCEEQGFPDIIE